MRFSGEKHRRENKARSIVGKTSVRFLVGLIAIVCAASGCPKPAATVPNVVNMIQANAIEAIMDAGLSIGSITEQYHATVPDEVVISQNPWPV